MKKIILICICIAMSIASAFAQCSCRCGIQHQCCQPTNVFYPFTINGQECRFEGKNAYIAASHLLHADESYFLNIDNAAGQTVRVYKLKKKGEYAVLVGTTCYYYRNNTTISCRLSQLRVEKELYVANSTEGFVLGYDNGGRPVLAIFKD